MKKNSCIVDIRWKANHGIGRTATELLRGSKYRNVNGRFSDIFSPFDPIKLLFKCLVTNCWFLSPSYNCPIFWSSKSIITIHDLMHIKFPEYAGLKNRVYYRFLVKSVCKKSPLIFTVSEYTKNEIVKWAGINPDKVVVVYNGVDSAYNPSVTAYKSLKPYVFYIGDKKPHKNIKRLLQAFSQSQASKSHNLLLSGKENDEVIQWANEFGISDSIEFSGFIPEEELPSYFKGATALLLPSLFEGFGLPIIESMAVGTPVLTSNITAMPEVAGDAALLVNPYDVNDISQGIDRLVNDTNLRNQLKEKGLIRAKTFDWEHSRQIWNNSINKVIGNK